MQSSFHTGGPWGRNTDVMGTKAIRARAGLGVSLLAVALAAPATQAQETRNTDGAALDRSRYAVEEITVTARKREEGLQSTPVAVTAFSTEGLEKRNIFELKGIQQFTPNLRINQGRPDGGDSAAQIFMRGVGQNDFIFPNDPGVGLYLDDVYIARSVGGMMSLVDVERVEVLRGPQGTLYGRNTIGGAIKIVTNRPTNEVEGRVQATTGRFNRLDLQGYLSGPIVEDKLFAKVSAATINRDGYGQRLSDGLDLGDDNKYIARGMLRWTPRADLEISLSGDVTHQRENGAVGSLRAFVPGTAIADPAVGIPFDPTPGDALTLIDLYNAVVAPQLAPGLGLPADTQFDERWLTDDVFTSNGTDRSRDDLDIWGVSLNINWDISDNVSLKSITAYRDLQAGFSRDSDKTPLPIVSTDNRQWQNQVSQELQLSGNAFDDKLFWLLGAYYFDENARDFNQVQLLDGTLPFLGFEASLEPLNMIDVDNIALFGQASYDITPEWSVTAGLRYTWERKIYFQDHVSLRGRQQLVGPRTLRESWTDLSPRFGIEYEPSDTLMMFATVSKGFKSGGWSPRPTNGNVGENPFDPEKLWSFELGAKTSWYDNRLTVNLATFYNIYEDIQLTTVRAGQGGALVLNVENAAENEIKGVELEVSAVPLPDLSIDASVAYLADKYTELEPNVTIPEDAELPEAPSWNMNFGAQYTLHPTDTLGLTLRGDASYISTVEKDPINSPTLDVNGNLLSQPGYWLLDARLTLSPEDGPWQLAVFGSNLLDKKYLTNGINVDAFGFVEAYYGRPREWGLSLGYRF
ncbi:TonB-dependent receptor [Yunchengibacter salinarum]|uniref:TonB-dependent receptor n=1 Tax=Yunchengibacter salinarum TaxID=3133399 RepID=UPI0035B64904